MGINIKNAEVVKDIKALAKAKGTSMTDAVGDLVRAELAKLYRRENLAAELRKLSERTGPRFKEPWKSIDHGDLLYDQFGLPK